MSLNSWKEVAHLFANGRFRVIEIDDFGKESVVVFDGRMLFKISRYPSHNYTLIARPISDMTDEEISNAGWANHEVAIMASNHWENLHSTVFLYYLSIGVYPFDQSHFETEKMDALLLRKMNPKQPNWRKK